MSKQVRSKAAFCIKSDAIPLDLTEKYMFLYKDALLIDAKIDFDCYLIYVEYDRDFDKRFYQPRRKIIRPIILILYGMGNERLISFIVHNTCIRC